LLAKVKLLIKTHLKINGLDPIQQLKIVIKTHLTWINHEFEQLGGHIYAYSEVSVYVILK